MYKGHKLGILGENGLLKVALIVIGVVLGVFALSELHYAVASDNFNERFPELRDDFNEISSNITCKFDNEKISYRNDLTGFYAFYFEHQSEPYFISDEFPDQDFYLVLKDQHSSKNKYNNFAQYQQQSKIEAYIVSGTYECKEFGRQIKDKHKAGFVFLIETGVNP